MRFSNRIIINIWAMVMGGTLPAIAQSRFSPNTIHQLKNHSAKHLTAGLNNNVQAYVFLQNEKTDREPIIQLGIHINTDRGDILTINAPLTSISQLEKIDGVKYVQIASSAYSMLDIARPICGADKVKRGEELLQGYSGQGVIVGIIDAGFDYTHPAFRDSTRNTLRISRVWEQGYSGGTPPVGYNYGSELCNESEILAAAADYTTNSHGTHVASIAAGADYWGANSFTNRNPYYGIADEAEIVLVSKGNITPNNVNISDAIAYIFDYAESVGKPCVINMSLGMQIGPHDGTSPFDCLSDRLVGPGKILVGSAGNHGKDKIHTSQSFESASSPALHTFIDFIDGAKNGGELDIWGEVNSELNLQICIFGKSKGEAVDISAIYDMSKAEGGSYTYIPQTSASGEILITTEINPLNGKPHALVSFDALSTLRKNYYIGIIVSPRSPGSVHLWGDDNNIRLTNNSIEGWTDGDCKYTLAEIGGTGKQILSVGAFTTRTEYPISSGMQKSEETLGDIASFSGKGPSIDGRMKPEITAPGTYIIAAGNSFDSYLTSFPLATQYFWSDRTYSYVYMQGTSMAAPYVTGVLATWLEENPKLSPNEIRQIWQRSASKDEFTGTNTGTPSSAFGWGKIDAHTGLKEIINNLNSINHISEEETVKSHQTFYNLAGQRVDLPYTQLPAGIYLYAGKDGNIKKIIK